MFDGMVAGLDELPYFMCDWRTLGLGFPVGFRVGLFGSHPVGDLRRKRTTTTTTSDSWSSHPFQGCGLTTFRGPFSGDVQPDLSK